MSGGYAFRTQRTNRMKVTFWEGSGVCLLNKPVENGESHWPGDEDGDIRLAQAQLSALFEGFDWRRARKLAVGAARQGRARGQNRQDRAAL